MNDIETADKEYQRLLKRQQRRERVLGDKVLWTLLFALVVVLLIL